MRTTTINVNIESNVNIEKYSNSRIKITQNDNGTFNIKSSFKVYKCEVHSFVYRFLKSKLNIKSIKGVCSAPVGYFV